MLDNIRPKLHLLNNNDKKAEINKINHFGCFSSFNCYARSARTPHLSLERGLRVSLGRSPAAGSFIGSYSLTGHTYFFNIPERSSGFPNFSITAKYPGAIMSNESDMHRRKFMEIGIYAISGTIAAISAVVLGRFAVGLSFVKKRAKWVQVELGKKHVERGSFERVVLEYETKHAWLARNEMVLVYVKRITADDVMAISAGCTHLGCIVTWDEDQNIFKCPCHDGRYDADGKVLSGPPPAPLKRHPAKIEDGKIFLSTETVPFGGDTSEGV
jgi:Rieske Fe-S protein